MYLGSINWIADMGIALLCKNVNALEAPLAAYAQEDFFKLYMADTGLLVAMLDDGANVQIMEENLEVYKGAIFENVIAQILASNGHPLYFYAKDNSLELDFLLSRGGKILPLEVKANSNKAKSLKLTLQHHPDMRGIKLVNGNVGVAGNLITLPLYMAMFL